MADEKKTIAPFLKITGIVLCVLAVTLTSFHLWFRDHAEEVIEQLVDIQSNGKVNLKLKNFRFNYFSRKMELHNALFYTTDSLAAPTAYRFSVKKLRVEVRSLWQFIFNGKLYIDSLHLIGPDAEVIKHTGSQAGEETISVSQEMGKIYNSIRDALNSLNAGSLLIEEGSFGLRNKSKPEKPGVKITHIHFRLDNPNPDLSGKHSPVIVAHDDNMLLRTHNQNIIFPDGKHRLSFRNLRINVLQESIQMDSCTIAAQKSDSSNASFTLFFDTLRLSSVDFGALYSNNLIKADTVYCTQPQIKLRIALKENKGKNKKTPTLQQIIQPLTGRLQLGYISVKNANIDIAAEKNNSSTTFKSENDNIEITGLLINGDSSEPLSLKTFSMAIRDYETINSNKTLSFRFDSVKFNNNQFILSNFTVKTLPARYQLDAERNFIVPRLELSNLSWDELLFNRNIRATKAIMYSPTMNYKRIKPSQKNQKVALFRDLSNLDAIMELRELEVKNGNLNMELDNRTKIRLENTDMNISSNELLGSKNIKSIQRSFSKLQFLNGVISINELKAELKNVHFTGKEDEIEADEVIVYDPSKTLSAAAKNVLIDELYFNDSTRSLSIDGIKWQEASINLGSFPKQTKPSRSSIVLKNISGNNTTLLIQTPDQTINTFVSSVAIKELRKPIDKKTTITGLQASGRNFNIIQKERWIQTETFEVNDKQLSTFTNACFEQPGEHSFLISSVPVVKLIPDIQDIMKGKFNFENITIDNPVISYTTAKQKKTSPKEKRLVDFAITTLVLNNPSIYIENKDSINSTFLQWQAAENKSQTTNQWVFKNIQGKKEDTSLYAQEIMIKGNAFSHSGKGENKFSVLNNSISLNAGNLKINLTDENKWNWSATINRFGIEKINDTDIKNKKKMLLERLSVENISISSENSNNLSTILKTNPSFVLRNKNGYIADSSISFRWSNLLFDQSKRTLTADSILLTPLLSRDSFIASHPYQADYITARAGKITLTQPDLLSYINDTIIKARALILQQPVIDVYRDNYHKNFDPGHIKPLPTDLIKKFPLFISLDSLNLYQASISYSQVEKTTGMTGTVPFSGMNATITNIRNWNLQKEDSLRLKATALLLDTIPVTMLVKQSYKDTLNGMQITAHTGPADLKTINPLLIPLLSAKIKNGYSNFINMQTSAGEYIAYGKMTIQYQNLKVALVPKGKENKKTLKTRVVNFVANTFIIKNTNKGKESIVYFERNRDRSFFNYLAKMFFRGLANSAGVKLDRKKIRKYQQQLKKKKEGKTTPAIS